MKVLLLVMAERKANIAGLYRSIEELCDCTTLYLSDQEQDDLQNSLAGYDFAQYDYVLAVLRSKKMMQQHRFLAGLNNLVYIEYDIWLNYYPNKYKGKFSKLYRKTTPALIISSGFEVSKKLRKEGFEAIFIPKGYDQTLLKNLNQPRDIKYGFIGSVNNQFYRERVDFIRQAEQRFGLQAFQTDSGEAYLRGLNRIDFFISADIGFGEYMIKNFEAMACGCLLFAYNQGEQENQALGFKDMENVVLYSSIDELLYKLKLLEAQPDLVASMRSAGQQLAEDNYRYDIVGEKIITVLRKAKAEGRKTVRLSGKQKKGLIANIFGRFFG